MLICPADPPVHHFRKPAIAHPSPAPMIKSPIGKPNAHATFEIVISTPRPKTSTLVSVSSGNGPRLLNPSDTGS
jgi:hypothetical protein